MAEVLLRIEQLSKSFPLAGGKVLTAVENVSFTVEKGSICILLGPSGSGKSTIIQILMRFYPIQSGEVLVDGVDFRKYNLYSYRKHFGLVSQ